MQREIKKIRCSSVDSLFKCAPSILDEEGVAIESDNRAAEIGTAVHMGLADFVVGHEFDMEAEAKRVGLSDDEYEVANGLFEYGKRVWTEVKKFFVDGMTTTERHVEGSLISGVTTDYRLDGTVDVVGQNGADIMFVDWKTGFIDDDYHNQMFAYAHCLSATQGNAPIIGITVFLRHGYYRVVEYTPERIASWTKNLERNILQSGADSYRPGKHCCYCKKFYTCEARKQIAASVIDVMLKGANSSDPEFAAYIKNAKAMLSQASPENKDQPELAAAINDLTFISKLIEHQAEAARELIRQTIGRVGAVKMGPGRTLELTKINVKRLDATKALPLLKAKLGESNTAACSTISFTKAMNKYGAMQPKGSRAAARAAFEGELRKAGAINVTTQHRLAEVVTDEDSNESGGKDIDGSA